MQTRVYFMKFFNCEIQATIAFNHFKNGHKRDDIYQLKNSTIDKEHYYYRSIYTSSFLLVYLSFYQSIGIYHIHDFMQISGHLSIMTYCNLHATHTKHIIYLFPNLNQCLLTMSFFMYNKPFIAQKSRINTKNRIK